MQFHKIKCREVFTGSVIAVRCNMDMWQGNTEVLLFKGKHRIRAKIVMNSVIAQQKYNLFRIPIKPGQ
jgi:hypothetical protein